MEPQATISVGDGYRAMFSFIEAFWERGGKRGDELANLLSSMNFDMADETPRPLDIAQWQDWLDAVQKVRS